MDNQSRTRNRALNLKTYLGVLTKFHGFVSYFTTPDLRRPCHVLFFIASTQKDTVSRSLRHIESPRITFTTERSLLSAKRLRFHHPIYRHEFLRLCKFFLHFDVIFKVSSWMWSERIRLKTMGMKRDALMLKRELSLLQRHSSQLIMILQCFTQVVLYCCFCGILMQNNCLLFVSCASFK